MNKIKTFAISILIPILTGIVVGSVTSPAIMYNSLESPFLAPPGFVFPIVWTILYILMGISYGNLKINNNITSKINIIYYFQLIVNALWSIIFFTLEWRLFAFFWILLLIASVVIMINEFYKKDKLSALLQIPYLLWTLFAAYLNFAFYLLNQ